VESATGWVLQMLEQHAEIVLFFVLLIEESGVPLPLPGDLLMMLAGVRVSQGRMHLAVALVIMETATLVGSTLLYLLARRGGRPVLFRYGKFLHLELEKLERAEDFLRRHGWLAIVAGRIIPGLRIPTTLAAGVFAVPYRVFLPALALGASIYVLFFFLVGYFAGPGIIAAVEGIHLPIRLVAVLVGMIVVVAAFFTIRRRAHLVSARHRLPEGFRLETALMAGLLATATMSLAVDLLLYALTAFGHTLPASALLALGHSVGRRVGTRPMVVLMAGITVYFLLQLLWAIVYAHIERWLPEPDWVGGLLFATVPLAFSILVVLPAMGAGVGGFSLDMGWVPLAGELVRHAVYGVALAISYTLLTRARAGPPVPAEEPAADRVGV
jgi:membrane-associated protein